MPQDSQERKPDFQLKYRVAVSQGKSKKSKQYLKPVVIDNMCYEISALFPDGRVVSGSSFELQKGDNDHYNLEWKSLRRSSFRSEGREVSDGRITTKVEFANLMPNSIIFDGEECRPEGVSDIFFLFRRLSDVLQTVMSSLTYLGPLREEPSRRYIYEDEVVEVGTKGENAAYIFLAEQDNPIANHFFYDANSDKFRQKKTLQTNSGCERMVEFDGHHRFSGRAHQRNHLP